MTPDYSGQHLKLNREKGPAVAYFCGKCDKQAAEWSYIGGDPKELTGVSNGHTLKYSLDESYYTPLCRQCHHAIDRGMGDTALCYKGLHRFEENNTVYSNIVMGRQACRECEHDRKRILRKASEVLGIPNRLYFTMYGYSIKTAEQLIKEYMNE